ncbi:MAG: hypothetical protein P8Q97_06935 [Myxococcota bacterium]|nr:hypothetical protein [Myxococcota bacterium]
MSSDAFASFSPRRKVALIDLVETDSPEASRGFAAKNSQLAEEVGGRQLLANEAIVPIIIPDDRASAADPATGLLVVSQYPNPEAGRSALAKREEWGHVFSSDSIRSYAARPAEGIEALVERTLPSGLGLLRRTSVPRNVDTQQLDSLIEDAGILGGNLDISIAEGRWRELDERGRDRPIWMLNFLEFAEVAAYGEDEPGFSASGPISGARAYLNYGRGMVGSLGAVGGRIGWSGRGVVPLPGTDDGKWNQIAIAVYPSPVAMLTMLALPKYRAAHRHREAGLVRTRLLATRPLESS